MSVTTPPGLRERKRAQTQRRLEEAAIALVLRDGLAQVTVDAISSRADVSARTFFNYFDSKEDAVLGVQPSTVDDEALAAHRVRYAEADAAASIVGLLLIVLGPSIADPSFREARMRVLRENPELLSRQMARMARMTEELTAVAAELLAHQRPASAAGLPGGVAETLLMACVGALRVATRQLTSTEAAPSTETFLSELEDRAVTLVRKATTLS